MKKILFFITSLDGGGAEKVLVNLVNHLDKVKYDVTVQTMFDVGINKNFLFDDIHYKYVFKKPFRGNTQLFKLFSPNFLYKKMIKEQYDIVVSFFQSPITRIVAGCPDKDTKIVQWIHNEFHSKNKIAHCYKNVEECVELQKRFDATVYVSQTVKDIYLSTFPEIKGNDNVLYNVVETKKIIERSCEPIDEVGLYNAETTLISVGRLVPQKAFNRLLSIIKRLKDCGKSVRLLLLGAGNLEKELKNQASNLEINDVVTFLGYKENPYKYVKNADLFVCSSLHEGFSTAVTEALIVGTPVITALCSGMRELLGDNEYGVITDNDEDALFNGVLDLINDKNLLNYYREKAHERGCIFDTELTTSNVEAFFDSL
ncbi:MAG: glycosyltransferase [Erysipelotrichia bacterium]|nr:glycosyltransferase [Erysipelotrichia bacterium]